jgi:hypothetical protein
VTEVLCREVGAAHPDGALRQIRTMKRLLRDHYRVQQRLERYGVESLDDAVGRIAALSRQLAAHRARERRQAERRLSAIESLIARVDALGASATPSPEASVADAPASEAPASEAPASEAPDGPAQKDAAPPLPDALQLVEALHTELSELRLELWAHEADDAPASDAGETAADLLARLDDALHDAEATVERLRSANDALRARNDRLAEQVERLTDTVEAQRQRLQRLERAPAASQGES